MKFQTLKKLIQLYDTKYSIHNIKQNILLNKEN